MLKTKKEAREKGYRTPEEWLKKDRVPYGDGFPVKGITFYEKANTEPLITARGKRGYKLREGAEPVKRKKAYYDNFYYFLYRDSDFVPVRKQNKTPPREIDLLVAISTALRASYRYGDTADDHRHQDRPGLHKAANLMALKLNILASRGIKHAYQIGLIAVDKQDEWHDIYHGNGYAYHDMITNSNNTQPIANNCRLKDAVYTLSLIDIQNKNSLFGGINSEDDYYDDWPHGDRWRKPGF